jgi:hypothetical protein
MLRIATIIVVFSLIGPAATGVAFAQTKPAKAAKNCSVEGCITVCNRQGGRMCNLYCQNEMARKGC